MLAELGLTINGSRGMVSLAVDFTVYVEFSSS